MSSLLFKFDKDLTTTDAEVKEGSNIERILLLKCRKVAELIQAISDCSELKHLEIVGTSFESLDELTKLLEPLEKCNKLATLRLTHCNLSDEHLQPLLSSKLCEMLTVLDFTQNNLTQESIAKLNCFTHLTNLYLYNNTLGDKESIKSTLLNSIPTLNLILTPEELVFDEDASTEVITHGLLEKCFEFAQNCNENVQDMYNLSQILQSGRLLGSSEDDEIVRLQIRCAAKNHPVAQHDMGLLHMKNFCLGDDIQYFPQSPLIPKSNLIAHSWFEKSAQQGYAPAQYMLGQFHEYGFSSCAEKNVETAFGWYLKAAQQFYPEALGTVGEMYLYGLGVEKDVAKALEYFELGVDSGDDKSLRWIQQFIQQQQEDEEAP